MATEAKREAVHRKIDLFLERLTNGNAEQPKPYLYEIIDTVLDETQALQERKAEGSDLRELIIEMREGFKRMDARIHRLYRFLVWMLGVITRAFSASTPSCFLAIIVQKLRFAMAIGNFSTRAAP